MVQNFFLNVFPVAPIRSKNPDQSPDPDFFAKISPEMFFLIKAVYFTLHHHVMLLWLVKTNVLKLMK